MYRCTLQGHTYDNYTILFNDYGTIGDFASKSQTFTGNGLKSDF